MRSELREKQVETDRREVQMQRNVRDQLKLRRSWTNGARGAGNGGGHEDDEAGHQQATITDAGSERNWEEISCTSRANGWRQVA